MVDAGAGKQFSPLSPLTSPLSLKTSRRHSRASRPVEASAARRRVTESVHGTRRDRETVALGSPRPDSHARIAVGPDRSAGAGSFVACHRAGTGAASAPHQLRVRRTVQRDERPHRTQRRPTARRRPPGAGGASCRSRQGAPAGCGALRERAARVQLARRLLSHAQWRDPHDRPDAAPLPGVLRAGAAAAHRAVRRGVDRRAAQQCEW